MNVHFFPVLLFLAGCTSVPTPQFTAKPACEKQVENTDAWEIIDANRQWRTAFNEHNAQRIAEMYDEGAVLTIDAREKPAANIKGLSPQPIFQYFQTLSGRSTLKMKDVFGHARRLGDWGFVTSTFELTETLGGVTKTRTGKYTMSLRWQSGKWKVYMHHASFLLEPVGDADKNLDLLSSEPQALSMLGGTGKYAAPATPTTTGSVHQLQLHQEALGQRVPSEILKIPFLAPWRVVVETRAFSLFATFIT